MGLATGNQIAKPAARPNGHEKSGRPDEVSRTSENENRPLPENHSPQSRDDLQIVARATNDAVRDWDVGTGQLLWPQGLKSLLGYEHSSIKLEIGFWHDSIHPEDGARIATNIRDALSGNADKWSGEYRFRRADGEYVHFLERAVIFRDGEGRAVRFVGSLMDITARKQLHDQLCRSQK